MICRWVSSVPGEGCVSSGGRLGSPAVQMPRRGSHTRSVSSFVTYAKVMAPESR